MDSKTSLVNLDDPLVIKEVTALLKYATERGIDSVYTKRLDVSIQKYQLATASGIEMGGGANLSLAKTEFGDVRADIVESYAQLVKLTGPVTGRTLVQTAERFQAETRPLRAWTLFFLVLAVGNEILKAWLADMPEPEEGLALHLFNLRRYVLEYCAPFFWGALGSLAYILKRLSDIAEERTFDSALSHGWTIRVFLGAMLGGIIQFIYDPQIFSDGESVLRTNVIALGFLTGVGVKVVYGAIEKTIDVLASKLNLEAIRVTKADNSTIQTFLNDQLNRTDKDKEPEKRELILAMLGDLQTPKK